MYPGTVGGLLGHLCARDAHGHPVGDRCQMTVLDLTLHPPYVGLLEGRRVVDPVPGDGDHVAGSLLTGSVSTGTLDVLYLVSLHYEQLLLGARPGEDDLLVAGDQLQRMD